MKQEGKLIRYAIVEVQVSRQWLQGDWTPGDEAEGWAELEKEIDKALRPIDIRPGYPKVKFLEWEEEGAR